MPMPPQLTADQQASITAALFRREENAKVAAAHGVSERQIRRMIQNLKQHGTVIAPRLKKMGRPNILTKEIEDDLKEYVLAHPLALLEDMQKHIETAYNVKCSRASLSRRMAEMGFSRGIIRRGFRSTETTLPPLSQHDYERITADQAEAEARLAMENPEAMIMGQAGVGRDGDIGMGMPTSGGNNKKTKYAWLTEGEPVRKPKRKKSEIAAANAAAVAAAAASGGVSNMNQQNDADVVVQPGLDSMGLNGHMDGTSQEEVDLQRLGHEAQDRIAQSQYPLPAGQQHLPPIPAHDGYSYPHPSSYLFREEGQHQLPPLEQTHHGYSKRVSFSDQHDHQGT